MKSKTCVKTLLIIFLTHSQVYAQYNHVLNRDTINYVRNTVFNFINDKINLIELENFKSLKKAKSKLITYQKADTSSVLFNNLLSNPILKKSLDLKGYDSFILKKSGKKNSKMIHFSEVKWSEIKMSYCNLLIFPLIRNNDNLFLRVTSRSKNHFDDMYVGDLYFVLNKQMKITNFKFFQSTVDN